MIASSQVVVPTIEFTNTAKRAKVIISKTSLVNKDVIIASVQKKLDDEQKDVATVVDLRDGTSYVVLSSTKSRQIGDYDNGFDIGGSGNVEIIRD